MIERIDKKELLKMIRGLDEIARIAPEYPLDKYYLILCFNLLEIKETLLAEGVFDRIKKEYFDGGIKIDLQHAVDNGQRHLYLLAGHIVEVNIQLDQVFIMPPGVFDPANLVNRVR